MHIGVDIGGTNIAFCILDEGQAICEFDRIPFPKGAPYMAAVDGIAEWIAKWKEAYAAKGHALLSIGLAVPGSVDLRAGCVLHAYNLGFYDVPLVAALQSKFPSLPVVLANDADAAALAELKKGSLQNCDAGVLVTLGTGVGGGLILGGRLFQGGRRNGTEFGHMTLDYRGDRCTCGVRGCVETLCSGTWLAKAGQEAAETNPDGMLAKSAVGREERVTARAVVDCAKAGDAAAKEIFNRYIDQLGSALASCINLLDLERIAIGGGVSNAGDFLLLPLRDNVKQKAFFRSSADIVLAQLGEHAGAIGAALLYSEHK